MERKMNLAEIKSAALEMLLYVDSICKKEKLRYSIYYGTLLGAVRHGGFIPWDDDVDIVMPRNDYIKLLKILENDEKYILASPYNRTNYRYAFSKLFNPQTKLVSTQVFNYEEKDLGVFLDIFPFDGLPDNPVKQKEIGEEMDKLKLNFMNSIGKLYARSYSYPRSLAKLIIKYPLHRNLVRKGGYKFWNDLYEKKALDYPFEKSNFCGHLEYVKFSKAVYPTEWFEWDNLIPIQYEGYELQCIKNYEDFLTQYYGDYMKLPPKKEQISNHHYVAFWK